MLNVRKTSRDVYYFHEYVPETKEDKSKYSPQSIEISEKIIAYKNWDDESIILFTKELMEAIAYLTNRVMPKQVRKIGLVSVPGSEKGKASPTERSIEIIEKWYNEGKTESVFNCTKEIHNCSKLLERTETVPKSHLADPKNRTTYRRHFDTIRCNEDNLVRHYMTFILLDDITTKGTIMKACRAKLIFNGANKYYIYRLAIAETVR